MSSPAEGRNQVLPFDIMYGLERETKPLEKIWGFKSGTQRRYLSNYSSTVETKSNLKPRPKATISPKPNPYTFLIRGNCFCAFVMGQVSHTTTNMNATLQDMYGRNIIELREQVPTRSNELSRPTVSVERRATELKREPILHQFYVYRNGNRIGLITFDHGAPTDRCLQIFRADNTTQLVVKSKKNGAFSVFRDELSTAPLCNYHNEIRRSLEFHSKTKITAEEQQLCIAATLAYRIYEVQKKVK